MMDFYILSAAETLLYIRSDALDAVHLEDEYTLQATFPIDAEKPFERGQLIGFYDVDGLLQFFEIRVCTPKEPDHTVYIEAEHAALAELSDEIITDVRPTGKYADEAVALALNGSRWTIGAVTAISSQLSTTFYYISRWEALKKIRDTWGVYISFQWLINDAGIAYRLVNIQDRLGAERGKRFEIDKDITSISCRYEDRHVKTRLYGRGKGEEVGVTDSGDPTYGRRLTFADVEWATPANPADKPLGQEWIEDVEATALYGRAGRPRVGVVIFNDCEDAALLLQRTWDYLQTVNHPYLSIEATVEDMEALWGYQHEAVRLGDDCAVIVKPMGVEVNASIVKLARNLIHPEKTRITIGNYREDISDKTAALEMAAQRATALARMGADVSQANPALFKGIIDTMVTSIMSSGTRRYTDPVDGGDIYEADDGLSAMKLTGRGLLVAGSKVGGGWDWENAVVAISWPNGIATANLWAGSLHAMFLEACTLIAASGTFTQLTTGIAAKQRMEYGADPITKEPFIRSYNKDDQPMLSIDMDEITYPNGSILAETTIGDTLLFGMF